MRELTSILMSAISRLISLIHPESFSSVADRPDQLLGVDSRAVIAS